jgi:trypsin
LFCFLKNKIRSFFFSIQNLVGVRCTNLICINQAICSFDNQSCICQLGNQGRDCSINCGESYIQPNISSDRIINGVTAVKNSWPYIVYIQIGEYGWCSGSLIDSWSILTAAHCTYDREIDEFILWFGVHKLDEREIEMNMGIVEKRFVNQIINHPNYKIYPIKTYENDLAILRLSQSVEETAYIRYLCILPNDNRIPDIQLNDQVEIIGWGYINQILSNGTLIRRTNELQQASIRILPDNDCMEYRNNDQPLFQSKYMICAGTKDYKTDSCQGDSGGPLLKEYYNRW